MRLPWRHPKDPLDVRITIRRRTLLLCMDEAREAELEAIAAFIERRRQPLDEWDPRVSGIGAGG